MHFFDPIIRIPKSVFLYFGRDSKADCMTISFFYKLLLALILTSTIVRAQESIRDKILELVNVDEKIMMPMRDGIFLTKDIYCQPGFSARLSNQKRMQYFTPC